jgi:hypothetical protein
MAANNSISLVNLDFDTLKNQLKTYLKSQSQFTDYDFDGSNMSVLLDILSYNTHLNAFYLNMIASEIFLDSAQLRSSVISIAKSLNYTPRSAKSARAVLNVQFAQSGLQTFTIPKNTRFSGKNSIGTFQFLTNDSYVLFPSNGFFTIPDLNVFEGILTAETFIVNYANEGQRYILSNDLIDVDSIEIVIIEDGDTTGTIYSRATNIIDLNSTSTIYFIQATDENKYELIFGDNVFGKRPKDGSIVSVTYRVTVGPDGNKATNFILNDNLGALNGFGSAITPTISVINPAFSGAEAESIEEIRFRAPRFYQTQERAITTNDFSVLVTQQFQYIKSVHVYGGDQNGLFQYGQVFISPITFTGELTSQAEKDEIQTYLKPRATIGITPIVVDPDFLFVGVECEVLYRPSETSLSATDIQAGVKNAILQYNEDELTDFNTEFKTSRFEAAIDNSDPSISSNDTNTVLRKTFRAEPFIRTFPTVEYRNEIVPGTMTSSSFVADGRRYQYTDFNPNNNTFTVTQVENRAVITNRINTVYLKDITIPGSISYSPAGSIDYKTGSIAINAITPTSFEGRMGIDFLARPVLENIVSSQNDVIVIDPDNINVIVKQI